MYQGIVSKKTMITNYVNTTWPHPQAWAIPNVSGCKIENVPGLETRLDTKMLIKMILDTGIV